MADSYPGQAGLTAATSDQNVERVHRQRDMDERRYMIPVRVIAVHGGGVGPAPTLDVVPVIHGVDGSGQKYEHGTIYGVPSARDHSANGTLINDVQVGDMGMLHCADRDIGNWKTTGQPSMPESARRGGLGDGIFHGAAGNQNTPSQYFMFAKGSVTIADANGSKVTMAPGKVSIILGKGCIGYLGGDPADGGNFDFLMTASGPCSNFKGKTG